jgi:ankyrin repeat protein
MDLIYYIEGDPLQNQLVAASAAGDLGTIKKLVAEGVNPNFPDTRWGATPLHVAAAAGHLPVVTYLVQRSANLNSRDESGMTPLMSACSAGHNAVVLTLLNARADVRFERPEDGMSALKFALWGRCSRKVIKALLSKGASVPEPGFVIVHLDSSPSDNWQLAKRWATRVFVVVGLSALLFVIIVIKRNAA